MAHVNDVQVNYGWTPDGRQYADLTFMVNFDQNDLQYNQHQGMYIGFFGSQQQQQQWQGNGFRGGWGRPNGPYNNGFRGGWGPYSNGFNGYNGGGFGQFNGQFGGQFNGQFQNGYNGGFGQYQNQGQQLVWSTRETIAPNGMRSQMFSRRVMLNNQMQQWGNMQNLTAQVWLMPDYQEQQMGMPLMNGAGRVGFERNLPQQSYAGGYQANYPANYQNAGYQNGYYNQYPTQNQYGYGFPQAPYNWNNWSSGNQYNWNSNPNWSYAGPSSYNNFDGSYYNSYGQNGFGYNNAANSYNNYQYAGGSYGDGYNGGYNGSSGGYNNGYNNGWDFFGPGFRSFRQPSQPVDAYATAV